MLTNFFRVFKFAFTDLGRNKGVSVAAVFVLVVTIMLATGLFFFRGMTDFLISEIQDKIDITAYFKDSVQEKDILNAKDEISKISAEIKDIQYVSKEQALQDFTERHKDNQVLSRALAEVGDNPFLPSLNIKTSGDPAQYEEIANVLATDQFSKLIDRVDFSQKKDTIEKVFSIKSNINMFGLIFGLILVVIAVLVVFNTIKLAINNSKDEIGTMRLVGASNWFVRGPFIIQGATYGFIAFLISIFLSGTSAYFISGKITALMPGFNLFSYFLSNFWLLVLIQLIFGIGLGMLTSFMAVKKYLE